MRFAPPRQPSSAKKQTYRELLALHEPSLSRKRGARRSDVLVLCIPSEAPAPGPNGVAPASEVRSKWLPHPAASRGGTVPSIPPQLALSECSVEGGAARPPL